MNELLNIIYSGLGIFAIALLAFKIGKSEKFDKENRQLDNARLVSQSLLQAEKDRLDEIEKSIGGITSISLSPLRYVRLLRSERELMEIMNEQKKDFKK